MHATAVLAAVIRNSACWVPLGLPASSVLQPSPSPWRFKHSLVVLGCRWLVWVLEVGLHKLNKFQTYDISENFVQRKHTLWNSSPRASSIEACPGTLGNLKERGAVKIIG